MPVRSTATAATMPTESPPREAETAPAEDLNHEVTPIRAAVTAPARSASDSTATRRRGWGSAGVTSAFTGCGHGWIVCPSRTRASDAGTCRRERPGTRQTSNSGGKWTRGTVRGMFPGARSPGHSLVCPHRLRPWGDSPRVLAGELQRGAPRQRAAATTRRFESAAAPFEARTCSTNGPRWGRSAARSGPCACAPCPQPPGAGRRDRHRPPPTRRPPVPRMRSRPHLRYPAAVRAPGAVRTGRDALHPARVAPSRRS